MIVFPGFLRNSHHDWWHLPVIILVPSWTYAWLDIFIHSIITDTEWDGQNEFMIENYFSKSTLHLKEMFQDSQLTFLTLFDYLVLIVCVLLESVDLNLSHLPAINTATADGLDTVTYLPDFHTPTIYFIIFFCWTQDDVFLCSFIYIGDEKQFCFVSQFLSWSMPSI